jgi:hypothetical protein
MKNRIFEKCFSRNKGRLAALCALAALTLPGALAQQASGPPQPPRARSAGAAASGNAFMGVGIMDVDDAPKLRSWRPAVQRKRLA